ncbi:mechanosensitive ion channel protein 1/2/3 [Marchantia polymorpha subsp. ruderalis]|uniref:Mechanosensitive ion channel protein n=1 Tax=Marchantia polymorpha TaxID=3197 RepID=A0A2R6WPA5_MARPO|nr:hypothetical protein MARPO_0069s0011 [Marchantia polymorpha]BBN03457.1 hypothetical protein Mp_2g23620 [Marchantia polymorpha subsp. ruderalis]|eukprot:PTQ35663.1 hypothetical protein MARPO_0069s0011 [Marchantia polymorpha]
MSIGSLQLVRTWGLDVQHANLSPIWQVKQPQRVRILRSGLLGSPADVLIGKSLAHDAWCRRVWAHVNVVPRAVIFTPIAVSPQANAIANVPGDPKKVATILLKVATFIYNRSLTALQSSPLLMQCIPAVTLLVFSIWGLGPTMRFLRRIVKKKEDSKWATSRTQHATASYIRPILLWFATIWICRAFDPVVLSTEASHAIKERFVNFVRSLSTVLAFAYCTASLTQQVQKMMMERQENPDSRNIGVSFIGNTLYTSVWVAAVCLFMELLGFSTQKWITAGGFGTVLLTLAGREIFTNFLSSIMIHATRPFVENEWIQTKIEGQEVSGTVEHVGWWSPTVIRGDDREAVHIPNHKFTVSVVRNLSQKTHWRIKTHIGISHLDAGKITNIVADMRKVLSKHPQVEQQRLHRRAFFDNVDPENQALLILVSCFVKTSHFEEYLRVKEIILLDLLRVISHHNARLATPIRSVQRILDEGEARQSPFRDVRGNDDSRRRPYMLIEASNVRAEDSDDDDVKLSELAAEVAREAALKAAGIKPVESSEETADSKGKSSKSKDKVTAGAEANSKPGSTSPTETYAPSSTKSQLEGLDSMGLNSNDITLLKAAFEKPPVNIPEGHNDPGLHSDASHAEKSVSKAPTELPKVPKVDSTSLPTAHEAAEVAVAVSASDKTISEQHDDPWREPPQIMPQPTVPTPQQKAESGSTVTVQHSVTVQQKSESGLNATRATEEKTPAAPVPRLSSVEDNLVLGVALDGPKRTLPLDDDIPPPAKQRELVISRNGNGGNTTGKDRRDPSTPQPNPSSPSTPFDGRDRER